LLPPFSVISFFAVEVKTFVICPMSLNELNKNPMYSFFYAVKKKVPDKSDFETSKTALFKNE
jgi:hypothetical protein